MSGAKEKKKKKTKPKRFILFCICKLNRINSICI